MSTPLLPRIIQGGMGVGVSGWQLARAVSQAGHLGVVSGTALAIVIARRLQLGDPGGHLRRAFARFPFPHIARRALADYFIPAGKPPHQPFALQPFPAIALPPSLLELTVLANFAEVFLAKEAHHGLVGVNYLEKIQFPTLPSLYGAMLAGVDVVLMGAGVPRAIPGILDDFAAGRAASLKIDVAAHNAAESPLQRFDPAALFGAAPPLKRPTFLAIVASATLAVTLARKSSGAVDGFIVEGPSAGGHNAPPRGPAVRNHRGEPVYGPRDCPDLHRFRDLAFPFWLAGSFASPARFAQALDSGASGIQVGTAFAFCEESGLDPQLKQQVIDAVLSGDLDVVTDPVASPTGFPFKVVQLPGTLSEPQACRDRQRRCDVGYLRTAVKADTGSIDYRCPAEPVHQYIRKGGRVADACGRGCLCNGLLAAIGLAQVQPDGSVELPLITAGQSIRDIAQFLSPGRRTYTAADVVQCLCGGGPQCHPAPSLTVPA